MKPANVLVMLCALFMVGSASAVVIEYEQIDQTGSRYEYTYTVANEAASSFDISWFTIYFEAGSYENIEITASPVDWDPYYEDPIPALPFDGIADWLSFGAPIAAGEELSGFSVAFDWIGVDSDPFETQFFEIYDLGFSLLASGETELAGGEPPVDVPEPGSIFLVMLGLAGLVRLRGLK